MSQRKFCKSITLSNGLVQVVSFDVLQQTDLPPSAVFTDLTITHVITLGDAYGTAVPVGSLWGAATSAAGGSFASILAANVKTVTPLTLLPIDGSKYGAFVTVQGTVLTGAILFKTTPLSPGGGPVSGFTHMEIDSIGPDGVNPGIAIGKIANTQIGFYGVTPVARQVLATGAGHSVDDVIQALQNLGLVSQM